MPYLRPQYHFRETANGLDAWRVSRLIELSEGLPIKRLNPSAFAELHANHWYKEPHQVPSPESILEHVRLIQDCDLNYPIILDASGRVMDGMHRICRAILDNKAEISAVQFELDPPPDHRDCSATDLSYE